MCITVITAFDVVDNILCLMHIALKKKLSLTYLGYFVHIVVPKKG